MTQKLMEAQLIERLLLRMNYLRRLRKILIKREQETLSLLVLIRMVKLP